MTPSRRSLPLALALLLLLPSAVLAAGVAVTGTPFPSDIYTVPDPSHLTGVRVNLPKPNCAARPSDCADIDVLNTLDGFNLQPRISITFTGAIDTTSVSSATVYLVSLGSTTGGAGGKVVVINQAIWEPAANTLHVESDEALDQHTRYVLIVTRGLRDAAGDAIDKTTFPHDLNFGQTKDPALKAYRKALLDALDTLGLEPDTLAAVSVFTTQSASAVLEKIRAQIKAQTPAPAFIHGTFSRASITSVVWSRQVGTAAFTTAVSFNLALLNPAAVGAITFGQFQSPDYETPLKFIPPVGTKTGTPAVQGTNTLQFDLVLPLTPAPAGGYPVVIFGHGFTDSKHGAPNAVAATLAASGLATIAINVVGHGGGALGTLTINRTTGAPVVIPDGGRGFDQNGDGAIDSTEGVNAVAPLIGNRDGLRQTVADIMQLVRLIQTGGIAGLSTTRIYYAGQSFGGIYGGILLGVESDIRAGVLNVPGGPIIEIARLSPSFRGLVALSLGARTPSLLNGGSFGFTENIPLRNLPLLVDVVPGASAIQEVIDDTEWVSQSGNPNAYVPHIRTSPLTGDGTPVIVQFAKGDRTVPNPTATALIRAGDLADRATFFRNDLNVPFTLANPHTFLTFGVGVPPAIQAQTQMAIFLASDGATTVDPDGAGPLFEVPIAGPLPEGLNF
ncbi:MAG TPA: Ig-like domain-containing protein [Methylomirabilota bacterium]|jgi:fermentation-respiration switch protein FrsA (DUF1100 family)|nr:Ig-like domain-containing protein [Methylomirabilota bacterium]